MRYDQPEAGEWIQPVKEGYKLACCDCGLVHTVDFRIHKGRVQFRVFRNNRSTAAMRRKFESIKIIKQGKNEVPPAP